MSCNLFSGSAQDPHRSGAIEDSAVGIKLEQMEVMIDNMLTKLV